MKKIVLALFVLLMFASVGVVFAQDELIGVDTEDYGHVHILPDHRLNAFDLAAPIAIYDHTTMLLPTSSLENPRFIPGFEVWAYDPRTDTGQEVLRITRTELNQLLLNVEEDMPLVTNGAYTLNYSTDGYFWVTAPDYDGSTYSFLWES